MSKLKDVCEIYIGLNSTNNKGKKKEDDLVSYRTVNKDSILFSAIIEKKLKEESFIPNIKDKYILKRSDIIIYSKKQYKVAIYLGNEKNIIVPNSFFIINKIDKLKYDPIFLAYYLNKIINNKYDSILTLQDIEELEIPDYEIKEQRKISSLLYNLNQRINLLSNIIENDSILIDEALGTIIGDDHE